MDPHDSDLQTVVQHIRDLLARAGHKSRSFQAKNSVRLSASGLDLILDIRWKQPMTNVTLLEAEHSKTVDKGSSRTVIATQHLTQGLFHRSREQDISVVDVNGNGVLCFPGFHYERYVESQHNGRLSVKGTPFSMKASRIVRAVLSNPARLWTQRELVSETLVTQGYASSRIRVLIEQGYLRDQAGTVRLVDPDRLLDEWARHYRFDRHRQLRFAMSAVGYDNGLEKLGTALRGRDLKYAFTGWSGAHLRAPYAIPPLTMAFVDREPADPQAIGLYPVDHGENVVLVIPQDIGVLQFTRIVNGLAVAADPQIYVDLRRMPGRAVEQADMLRERQLNWSSLADA